MDRAIAIEKYKNKLKAQNLITFWFPIPLGFNEFLNIKNYFMYTENCIKHDVMDEEGREKKIEMIPSKLQHWKCKKNKLEFITIIANDLSQYHLSSVT